MLRNNKFKKSPCGVQVSISNDELKLMIEGAELQNLENNDVTITTEECVSYIRIPLIKASDHV